MISIDSLDTRIKVFLDKHIDFSEEAKVKLEKILALEDVWQIIALPDIHSKPDNPFPTGVVTATSKSLYPSAIGQEIGCGMRVIATSLESSDIKSATVDKIFFALKEKLRDGKKGNPLFSKKDYFKLLRDGVGWSLENFKIESECRDYLNKNVLSYESGSVLQDITAALPVDSLQVRDRLGSLGGGNHFLELQVFSQILDSSIADRAGLKKGKVAFIFHTGSGTFGKRLDNYYGMRIENNRHDKKMRQDFRKILFHFKDLKFSRSSLRKELFFSTGFRGIPAESIEGRRYINAYRAAMNFSFVNRAVISDFIRQIVVDLLGETVAPRLLSDTSHERIDFEEIKGKRFWVHRNGATRLSRRRDDFFIIPAFLGGPSVLCVPGEAIEQSLYSVNHGVGRVFSKQEARGKFEHKDIFNTLREKGINLYRLGRDDISQQAPAAFKDIDRIIGYLIRSNLVKPVAILSPRAILKG